MTPWKGVFCCRFDLIINDESKKGSSFKGAINNENAGEVNLVLDSSSTLTLTGDTYIKSLTNADTTNSNINLNGHKLYVDGVGI